MRKIYYAIVETMEIPDDTTDEQIDDILMRLATENGTLENGKDYVWSDKNNLLYDHEPPY